MRSLRLRLTLWIAVGTLLLVPALAWLTYRGAAASVTSDTEGRLSEVAAVLVQSVTDWFTARRVALASLSDSDQTRAALTTFEAAYKALPADLIEAGAPLNDDAAWARIGGDVRAYYERTLAPALTTTRGRLEGGATAWMPSDKAGLLLQYLFIASNPAPPWAKSENNLIESWLHVGQGDPIRHAMRKASYASEVTRNQLVWQSVAARSGFDDLALVGRDGTVVYTLQKGLLLGQNLRSAQQRFSPHGKVFAAASYLDTVPASAERRVLISPLISSDYDGDAPSYLFAAAVTDSLGRSAGVLIARTSAAKLDPVFDFRGRAAAAGLGQTGFAVLIGDDGRVATQHRFVARLPAAAKRPAIRLGAPADASSASSAGAWSLAEHPATKALYSPEGLPAGTLRAPDETGEAAIWAYAPVAVAGTEMGVLVAQQTAEGLRVARSLRDQTLVLAVAAALLAIGAGWWLASSVAKPVEELAQVSRRVQAGELAVRATVYSKDEIGEAAAAFNSMLNSLAASREELSVSHARLTRDVGELAVVLEAVERGDLRIRSRIDSGPLRLMAGRLNVALARLHALASEGRALSDRVAADSASVRAQMADVMADAQNQTALVTESGRQIERAAQSVETTTLAASTSRDHMQSVLQTTRTGAVSIDQVASGMTSVRNTVRMSVRGIKTAAESATAIDAELSAVGTLCAEAQDAAANAELADDTPQAKAMMIAEMRRFARAVSDTYALIQSQMAGLFSEISRAVTSVESEVSKVESQVELTAEAKRAFVAIEARVSEAHSNVQAIASFAVAQNDVFDGLRHFFSSVVSNAEKSLSTATATTERLADLERLAEVMAGKISQFHTLDTECTPPNHD